MKIATTARPSSSPPAAARRRAGTVPALAIAALAVAAGYGFVPLARSEAAARLVPPPAADVSATPARASETAVIAGGCFWGVQGVFQHVAGVTQAVSGYAGGNADTASYRIVGTGATGHAEAVRISYDPKRISYGRLLQIYFSVAHDPTELNRQGPDRGTQYRSTIFPADAEQARVARAYVDQLTRAGTYGRPLATTVEPLKAFFPAEAYHQDYLTLHPDQPYIAVNDLPKVENLKRLFPAVWQAQPALVGAARAAN